MAAVFDGKTKTGRAVSDPGTDDMLPNPASLVFGAINTPVGLSGTVGAEGKLVHGDRWEQLDGSLMEITNTNVTTTIMGNETRQITGNQTLTTIGNVTGTVVSNMNQTVVGSSIHTNVGAAAHTYISNHVQTHCSPQNVNEPGTFLHFIQDLNAQFINYKNIAMIYFQLYTLYVSITPVYINMTPTMNLAYTGFNFHWEGFDNQGAAMDNKLRGMKSDIGALKGKVEAMHTGTPVSITAIYLAVNCYVM